MPFWLGHAFEDHANETLEGHFISPVTNELMVLSWSERAIAEAICRRLPFTKELPWGDQIGFKLTRATISKWVGKPISDNLYKIAITNLELAGLLSVIRERGEGHKVTPGRLLRCDQKECQDTEHYPKGYPLPNVSASLPKQRRDIALGEETPEVWRDIKNLNNPLITSNSYEEVAEVFEVQSSRVSTQVESRAKHPDQELQEWLDALPANWVAWSYASAKAKGFDKPTKIDLAYAERIFEETGLDLEPGGAWQDGKVLPQPSLKSVNDKEDAALEENKIQTRRA